MTKFLNISTDNTLGGVSPSDETVVSQKAIKNYVDTVIPTVNDATITITQGGVTKGSFTLNQASGDTIALDAGGGGSSLDAGFLCAFAGSAAPAGWLVCDGSAVSRTTYADLFTAIGTTYGTGDGSTTFNLPNRTPTRTIIESKNPDSQDSFRWYRLYDDGFVEQGGTAFAPVNKLVPMLVEMADTYYDAVVTPSSNINVWPLAWADRSRSTTTSVYIDGYGDLHQTNRNIDVNWMVSGMSTRGATQQNIVCIKY